jgi:class 3 adenylate cyclase/tetratricopeptide (TPR) repeat protein
MDPLSAWLQMLGLERYAGVFAENEVDLDTLRVLTEADLEQLGLPFGPRKRLVKALADLESKPGPLPLTPFPPDQLASTTASSTEAERRQLTVMFCDLVGSTALSHALDPEQLRELMRAYQQASGQVVEKYGGHVAQYLGDGLMVYFGWPRAHEDDAERAVRAGLEIVEAVKAVEAPEPLQVRVGVATGLVVVGETGAGDASVPKLAVGETPNLAARVQGLAGPDEIVIGPSTRRLVGGTFELDDIGKHALKGIVEPVRAWKVGGVADTEGRFEAAHGMHLTPLIGREEEIGLLMRRWGFAKEAEGQVVLLCGQPGIGKSRITQVLREKVASESHTRLRYQCSPHYVNSALYPIITQFERAADFERSDSNEAKLRKMEEVLKHAVEDISASAPLFASLLSIPTSGRYPPLGISSQKQKELTLQALGHRVFALAAKHPVLMIFEDVHWIDPTSQEALNLNCSADNRSPGLVGHHISYRPEYQPPWLGLGHVTPMTLTQLARREAAALVDRVTGGKPLPGEVLDQIVAKTDGVPLFVEELTKTVIESGLIVKTEQGYRLIGTLADIAIPSTLQDSLMARLDRQAPMREIAQIGSCIGREFSYELISAVSPLRDNQLNESLEQLVNSELLYRVGTPPRANYTFKHALVQDAAYASLLKSKKQELHARIARVMESGFQQVIEAKPELIARHYTEAGLSANAIPFWLKAGELCIARAAHQEALVHLREGLALVTAQPATATRSDTELAYQMNIGSAYNVLQGWSAPEVKIAYERARGLVNEVSDPTHSFNALMGLFYYYNVAGDINASTPIIEEAASLAEAGGYTDQLVVARQGRGQNLLYRGRFAESADSFEGSLTAYDREKHAYLSNIWGGDFFTYDQAFLGCCYWHLGQMQAAYAAVRRCIEHANSFQDPIVHIVSHVMAAVASLLFRDWQSVINYATVSETKAEAYGMLFHQIFCPILRGCAMVHSGAGREGHDLMKTHLEMTRGDLAG